VRQRNELYRQLGELGDFWRRVIPANYRKCGKAYCACAWAGHPGMGRSIYGT
jgi:hypothetical protein